MINFAKICHIFNSFSRTAVTNYDKKIFKREKIISAVDWRRHRKISPDISFKINFYCLIFIYLPRKKISF